MPLTDDEITALLEKKKSKVKEVVTNNRRPRFQNPPQMGPVRRYEETLRCASRNCSCPTNFKLQGIPYCTVHLITLINLMLIDKGVLS